MDFHTSREGSNDNNGLTTDQAFATVRKGVNALGPGDRLLIAAGTYVERVRVTGRGDDSTKTQILPLGDGPVTIDGSVNTLGTRAENLFREVGNDDWLRVGTTDEWVSAYPLPRDPSFGDGRGRAFGAFIAEDTPPGGRPRHERLITHGTWFDLSANNQKFGPMPDDMVDPPGFHALEPKYPLLPRRPWVYLGPGVWQDCDDFVHIRLTATTHASSRVSNYRGPIDPRQVSLAICTQVDPALAIVGCHGVELRDITVRGGGGFAVSIERSHGTVLDGVTILAGRSGLRIHDHSQSTKFLDCVVDGGIPPWMFRSDIKDDYVVVETGRRNFLGQQTSNTLLLCASDTDELEFDKCEFRHGHDLQLGGKGVDFHHCYVEDVNDDFPFIGQTAEDMRIHHNVVERVRTFLNVTLDSSSGPVRIYRNLVDLRHPVLGRRPHPDPSALEEMSVPGEDDDGSILDKFDELDLSMPRFGIFYKTDKDEADPELDIFQNTILLANSTRVAAYPQFFAYNNLTRRRVLNNIFVAFLTNALHNKPIVALPLPNANSITDGNAYLRIGTAQRLRFLREHMVGDVHSGPTEYDTLDEMRGSAYFTASLDVYPNGYERRGIDEPPGFRHLAAWPLSDAVRPPEDLRLLDHGALARQHGVPLPPELSQLDPPDTGPPDIGCYRVGDPPLRAGVGGNMRFPFQEVVVGDD